MDPIGNHPCVYEVASSGQGYKTSLFPATIQAPPNPHVRSQILLATWKIGKGKRYDGPHMLASWIENMSTLDGESGWQTWMAHIGWPNRRANSDGEEYVETRWLAAPQDP